MTNPYNWDELLKRIEKRQAKEEKINDYYTRSIKVLCRFK